MVFRAPTFYQFEEPMNRKRVLIFGVVFVLVLGAFGAHALKDVVKEESALESFKTGVYYQMFHGLSLIVLVLPMFKEVSKWISNLMIVGTLFFSGSIYFLVLGSTFSFSIPGLFILTPVGGTLLIIGWGLLLKSVLTNKITFEK